MERAIIHLNVTDFAVAVERLLDRSLSVRPLIMTATDSWRAVVHDMSEEAFQEGVRKGMLLRDAQRFCRKAILRKTRPEIYRKAMQGLLRQVLPYSPLVETGKNDGHLFVDVTGTNRLFGPPPDIASQIRKNTREHLGLNPIWTVAANKLVAKVASRMVKPTGECIVAPGNEKSFLAPLPTPVLPGLYPQELTRLEEFNLSVIGDVAALSRSQLVIPFGKRAEKIYYSVRGIDTAPVCSEAKTPPKIWVEHLFAKNTCDWHLTLATLFQLAEKATRRLRHKRLVAHRICLWLEYADRKRTIRQATVKRGVNHDDTLFSLARDLLQRAWSRRVQLRRLRLVFDRLMPPACQPLLFSEEKKHIARRQNLATALDRIRGRYGGTGIRHGRCLLS